MKRYLPWLIAAGAVVVFVLMRRGRGPGAAALNAPPPRPFDLTQSASEAERRAATVASDPMSKALETAQRLANEVRKDPGVGTALGLDQGAIDRITLTPSNFARQYLPGVYGDSSVYGAGVFAKPN